AGSSQRGSELVGDVEGDLHFSSLLSAQHSTPIAKHNVLYVGLFEEAALLLFRHQRGRVPKRGCATYEDKRREPCGQDGEARTVRLTCGDAGMLACAHEGGYLLNGHCGRHGF